jgi:hypothetical protein
VEVDELGLAVESLGASWFSAGGALGASKEKRFAAFTFFPSITDIGRSSLTHF